MWVWANRRRRAGWVLFATAVALVAIAEGLLPMALALYSRLHIGRCTWDASGKYQIDQTDNFGSKSYISLDLSQKGKDLNGVARSVAGGAGLDEGKLQGAVDNTDIKFHISWNKGAIGVYVGSFDSKNGHLQGTSFDKETRANTASWSTLHLFSCK
jgi:hypothetical protein